MNTNSAALLLLADSRFPTGAHAHSGGMEAAIRFGWVTDINDLAKYLKGRIATNGRTEAAFAAATASGRFGLRCLDDEAAARIASPIARKTNRALGRQLTRAASKAWPRLRSDELLALHPDGPMQSVALGCVASAANLQPIDAALCSLHHMVGTATSAAIRLLGLDPFLVHAVVAELASQLNDEAAAANAFVASVDSPSDLVAHGSITADICAEDHATWEVRLFAS